VKNTHFWGGGAYIPVHDSIVVEHDVKFCENLPAAHTLTGCEN
jgi:hypothetical protein